MRRCLQPIEEEQRKLQALTTRGSSTHTRERGELDNTNAAGEVMSPDRCQPSRGSMDAAELRRDLDCDIDLQDEIPQIALEGRGTGDDVRGRHGCRRWAVNHQHVRRIQSCAGQPLVCVSDG